MWKVVYDAMGHCSDELDDSLPELVSNRGVVQAQHLWLVSQTFEQAFQTSLTELIGISQRFMKLLTGKWDLVTAFLKTYGRGKLVVEDVLLLHDSQRLKFPKGPELFIQLYGLTT